MRRITEHEIINKYIKQLVAAPLDDCSYVDNDIITSVDCLVEGLHFTDGRNSNAIAKRAIRASFSDIYAQGAKPLSYIINLCLPDKYNDDAWLDAMCDGARQENTRLGVDCIGGNTCVGATELSLAVTVFGTAAGGRVTRYGAKEGEGVFVTGNIGDALISYKYHDAPTVFVPVCRMHYGMHITSFATSAMDISDGLMESIAILESSSNVEIELYHDNVPISQHACDFIAQRGINKRELFSASDDYELIFTSRMTAQEIQSLYGLKVYKIGLVSRHNSPLK